MKATDQIREPHSVWLCLSETDNQFLSRIIATFCNLTGTANFQPHVTLLGDIDAPRSRHSACAGRYSLVCRGFPRA